MERIFDHRIDIDKCLQCGFCREVCPLFSIKKSEGYVARGFVHMARLLEQDALPMDAKMRARIDQCLLCSSCTTVCPAGIELPSLIMAIREKFVEQNNLPWDKRIFLRWVMADQARLKRAMALSKFFKPLLFHKVAGREVLQSRFPLPILRSFKRIFPDRVESEKAFSAYGPGAKAGLRVAYFTGCASGTIYPEISESVVAALTAQGIVVDIPAGQQCCGRVMFSHGERTTGRNCLEQNIELLAKLNSDLIVTSCPSCLDMLTRQAPNFFQDRPELLAKMDVIREKLIDFTELILDFSDRGSCRPFQPLRVSVHDPCHSKSRPHLSVRIRQMLSALPGVTLQELESPDFCCGGAGSYNFFHYPNARRIRERKIADIARSDPDIVCTTCPECKRFITEGVIEAGLRQKVLHPAELLGMVTELGFYPRQPGQVCQPPYNERRNNNGRKKTECERFLSDETAR